MLSRGGGLRHALTLAAGTYRPELNVSTKLAAPFTYILGTAAHQHPEPFASSTDTARAPHLYRPGPSLLQLESPTSASSHIPTAKAFHLYSLNP